MYYVVFSYREKSLLFPLTRYLSEGGPRTFYEVSVVDFQNKICYSSRKFLNLLPAYLQALIVHLEGSRYIQKDGICMGTVIAPILSNLYLGKCDKKVENKLLRTKAKRVLRNMNVDDHLAIPRRADGQEKISLQRPVCQRA